MKIALEIGDLTQYKADAVVVNLFEGVTQPGGGTGAVDQALNGLISEELKQGQAFTGKLGETLVLPTGGKIPARYVVIVGLGKSEKFKGHAIRRASAAAIRACLKLKVKTVSTILHGAGIGGFDSEQSARLVAEGSLLGAYKFKLRKTQSKPEDAEIEIESVTIVERDSQKRDALTRGVRLGTEIARATNQAREWVFDSANNITPQFLADAAQSLAKGRVTCKILEQPELEKLKLGAFLNVAKGSVEPPKLVHLTYTPPGTIRKKVTLVGKRHYV